MSASNESTLRPLPNGARICYLIGAGFSRASCYQFPTAIGFLSREWKYPTKHGDANQKPYPHHNEALDIIEKEYSAIEQLDVEAVLTDLYIRTHGIGQAWQEDYGRLIRVYESLVDYIGFRLQATQITDVKCEIVQRFVDTLRSQDHILSLNYDTLLEQQIRLSSNNKVRRLLDSMQSVLPLISSGFASGNSPVFIAHDANRRGFFAKLHGSIDWNACPNRNCPFHNSIEILSPWARTVVDPSGQYRCSSCGSFPVRVIIPPVASKAFERYPKLGIIWHRAYNCIRSSQRFVLMGVSLATTDHHLASLIRHATRISYISSEAAGAAPVQICIVNKSRGDCEQVKIRLLSSLPPDVKKAIDSNNTEVILFHSIEEYIAEAEQFDSDRTHTGIEQTTTSDF